MKFNNKYIIIFATIIVVIILVILIKPLLFRNQLIKNFKKNGIDLRTHDFKMPYFNNTFKMSLKASSDFLYADIKEFSGEYNFESIYSNVPEFKSIYLNSGNIEILNKNSIINDFQLPFNIYIHIKNVKIKFKDDINQDHILTIDEITFRNRDNSFGCLIESFGKLKYNEVGFQFIFDRNRFELLNEELTKAELNKLNFPLVSLIKSGKFNLTLNVNVNSNHSAQNISAQLILKDFSIKTEKEINFIEKLFYSNIKEKYKTKEPVSEEIKIEFELPFKIDDEFLNISNANKIKSALMLEISKNFLK